MFFEAIVPPQPLQPSLVINSCFLILGQVSNLFIQLLLYHRTELTTETVFYPPIVYSRQCTSSIIATYVPVFVLLYLANLFVLPAIMLIRRAYFKRQQKQQQAINTILVEILSGTPNKPAVLKSLNFDRRSLRVTNLSVLLTFGWVFSPLAVLLYLLP